MKLTHKHFAEVTIADKRITAGGNEVYDATEIKKDDKGKDVEGAAHTLLTDKRYWEAQ